MELDVYPTLVSLILSLGLSLLFGYLGALPPDFKRGVRLIPWRFLMLLAVVVTMVLLVHLLTLLGLKRDALPYY
jgi:hypothetical protein